MDLFGKKRKLEEEAARHKAAELAAWRKSWQELELKPTPVHHHVGKETLDRLISLAKRGRLTEDIYDIQARGKTKIPRASLGTIAFACLFENASGGLTVEFLKIVDQSWYGESVHAFFGDEKVFSSYVDSEGELSGTFTPGAWMEQL